MIYTNIETWDDFISADKDMRRLFILTCRLKGMNNKDILLSLGLDYNTRTRERLRKHCQDLDLSTRKFKGALTGRENKTKDIALCWLCSNCYGGCSWSKSFLPVEGWKVEIRPKRRFAERLTQNVPDYFVIECPEFVFDEKFKDYRSDQDD